MSGKCNKKLLDHAKQSATEVFKTASKQAVQKAAETTADLIGNKIANKIMGVSKSPQQNYSETVSNEHDKEIPNERYTSPEEKQNIVDNLRIIIII